MKHIIITLVLLFTSFTYTTSAVYTNPSKLQRVATVDATSEKGREVAAQTTFIKKPAVDITISDAFLALGKALDSSIPTSYQYIDLYITGSTKGTPNYRALQKLVYVGAIPNRRSNINMRKNMTAYSFYALAERAFLTRLIQSSQISALKDRNANTSDLVLLTKALNANNNYSDKKDEQTLLEFDSSINSSEALKTQQKIFLSVYQTLLDGHFERENLDEVELIRGATQGLAKGTGDRFTTYFPPVNNEDFMQSLDGKFEGIGSYVDMEEPGVLKIVSPIAGSPSEKAGLKGGDIITHVDGKEILDTTSLSEAISWIKGPKGSAVNLSILRGNKKIEIKVIRDTIIIKNVEYEKLDSRTYYIKLVTFGENLNRDFEEALRDLEKQSGVKKVILDMRNNPGGYLHEANKILSHFIPKGQTTVQVKYLHTQENLYSFGYDIVDFSDYRLIILQNGGSASASEIVAGSIKDYLPNTTIVGEKSYGKGSVQTIRQYTDGSALKYTVAKWFTGKTATGIDGVGIPADVVLERDFENFKSTGIDNQLEKAKSIR